MLKELNGLRNRLVHHYNGIDPEIALRVMKTYHQGIKGY